MWVHNFIVLGGGGGGGGGVQNKTSLVLLINYFNKYNIGSFLLRGFMSCLF